MEQYHWKRNIWDKIIVWGSIVGFGSILVGYVLRALGYWSGF